MDAGPGPPHAGADRKSYSAKMPEGEITETSWDLVQAAARLSSCGACSFMGTLPTMAGNGQRWLMLLAPL